LGRPTASRTITIKPNAITQLVTMLFVTGRPPMRNSGSAAVATP
jgi:hypothetical protein